MSGEEQTKFAFFNGKIIDIDQANINIRTIVLHYGIGLFEGIRYYWNEDHHKGYLFRVKEHYRRMIKNAKILAMDIQYTADKLTDITIELLKKEDFVLLFPRKFLQKVKKSLKLFFFKRVHLFFF